MKKLKTIIIKIEAHIDDKHKLVLDEKTSNLEEVHKEVNEYFVDRSISNNEQDNEVKKRYNKSIDDAEKELLTEIKMPIFTKVCEEMLKVTEIELKETNSKLLATELRLNELEKILKANGLI
ncbi:hypothetical protein [Spiroplasma endosymbiont of Othius punctulatus]|uniref:hypothetical protein n=1 Tax=Spiroplasma endosymbiont of Othius punctulatus TaxID=3066289 RepID=UPI0030D4A197